MVEFRNGPDGNVVHFEEPEFSETTGKKLHKATFTSASEIVAMDFAGNIYKGQY